MTENVIPFPRPVARPEAKQDHNPRAAELMHQRRERLRLKQIRQACQKGAGKQLNFQGDDAARAGKALHELKCELLTRRGQVKNVKDNFPKLHRFLVSEDLPTVDSMLARAKNMTQFVGPYLAVARAIANEANANDKECQIRVLRATTLWQGWASNTATQDANSTNRRGYNHLAWLISAMGKRVARDTKLYELFEQMRLVSGQYNIATEEFERSTMAAMFGSAYENWNECYNECPPLPGVPLVKLWHAGWELSALVTSGGSDHLFDISELESPVGEGDEYQIEIHLYQEIRLVLGPTVDAKTIGPMFESRPQLEIRLLDHDGAFKQSGIIWNVYAVEKLVNTKSFAVKFNELWQRFTPLAIIDHYDADEDLETTAAILRGENVDHWRYWETHPLSEDKQLFEHFWISWTTVDGAHVKHWLDKFEEPPHPVEFLPAPVVSKHPASETWIPRPHLGHFVEIALNNCSIELALRSAVDNIRSSFHRYESDLVSRMEAQTANQIAEFESDIQSDDSYPSNYLDKNDE